MTDVTNIGPVVAARFVQPPAGRSAGSATPSQFPAADHSRAMGTADFQSIAEEVQREQLTQAGPPKKPEAYVNHKHNEQLDQAIAKFNRSVNFRVDQETGITILTVRDRGTNEGIRQIPPDEFLSLVSRLEEMRGIFFEDTA